MEFTNVTALAKGNVYFEGKVISHTILLPDGSKKTLGAILPGEYHFGTEAAERMDIVGGSCHYQLDGSTSEQEVGEGSFFEVAAHSGFTITVTGEPCHYVCSYL
ncbi:pyrimidine/purine nucleoside phosphorylase [Roseibacillus ishigakijimensis]|uniref:Pyrimidine/purine nucleoside phosphorylase n=2 Tax=Roseibacillus ishigakijimensis TaxID=454146 RepID=A0A934RTE3_9BACT|nr:pyrimidine/purine nucleoside phosphorylase [Roseibacillus ishigakijimensis]